MVVLFNGNCIDIMETLIKDNIKVDMVLTSPPYDNLRNYNNSSSWNFDIFNENIRIDITKEVIKICLNKFFLMLIIIMM